MSTRMRRECLQAILKRVPPNQILLRIIIILNAAVQGIGSTAMNWAMRNLDKDKDPAVTVTPPTMVQAAWTRCQGARKNLFDLPDACVWRW